MADQNRDFSVRRYGDRWAVAVGDEVVLVSQTREKAQTVLATAKRALVEGGVDRPSEPRSFSKSED